MTRIDAGLGWMAGAWLAGLGLATVCAQGPWRVGVGIAALTLGALAGLLGLARGARAAWAARGTCAVAALLAGLSAELPAAGGEAGRIDAQGEARLVGEVERARVGEAVVRITGGAWLDAAQSPLPAGARVRLRPIDTTRGRTLVEGERFRALVRLRPTSEFRNPTPHPRWRAGAPLDGVARVRAGTRAESLGTPWPAASIGAVRAAVRRALDATLSARTAGVTRALVLGEGEAVDDDANRAVRDAGLAHVLAVSGLHVVILVGLVVVLLRRVLVFWTALAVRIDVGRVAAALGVPLALVYAALAGGAPSAWRAAVAAAMSYGLVAAGHRPRAGAVAAIAAMVLAAWSPADAMRPALLLSVLATAALVGAARPQTRLLFDADARPFARTLETVREATLASVRTTLATAPLVVWCFEGVPLVGIAANLALVPVGSFVLLPLAALHALVATLLPFAAPLTAAPLETCTRAFLAACEAFAAIPFGRGLPPLSVPQGLALAATCGLLFAVRTWRDRLLVLAAGALALCAAELHLRATEAPRGVLRATFLDVGQGDAALLDLPDGSLMLVDAGGAPRGGPDPGLRAIVPLLRARRREAVDVLVITHPHPDHYGGAKAVLDHVRVREVWDGGQGRAEAPDGEASRLLAEAQRRGARLRGPEALCDAPRYFGAARVEVLWPCPHFDTLLEPNDNSLVLRVTLGAHTLLLAGDVEREAERALVRNHAARLRADVLKVPHHGSRTSSGRAFLRAVRPRHAVVSAGRGNGFGHPHAEVLERLGRIGARVLRLDRLGGVIARSDGRTLTLTP
jgi:competence protein ComEC